jgi:hypothetical protein
VQQGSLVQQVWLVLLQIQVPPAPAVHRVQKATRVQLDPQVWLVLLQIQVPLVPKVKPEHRVCPDCWGQLVFKELLAQLVSQVLNRQEPQVQPAQ